MLASLLRKVSKASSTLFKPRRSFVEIDAFKNNLQARLAHDTRRTIDFWNSRLLTSLKILHPAPNLPRYHSFARQFPFLSSTRWMSSSSKKFKLVKRRSIVDEMTKSDTKKSKSAQDHPRPPECGQRSCRDAKKCERPARKCERPVDQCERPAKKCERPPKKCKQPKQDCAKPARDSECFAPSQELRAPPCNRRPERGSCCPQKEEQKFEGFSKSDCEELKPRASIAQEETAAPDPPPPRATHWSEIRKKPKPRSSPSPMLYIPSQKSSKKKLHPKNKSYERKASMRRTDCCRVSSEPIKSSPAGFVAYGFQEKPEAVGDARPNTEALKYHLSKCPATIGSLSKCPSAIEHAKDEVVEKPPKSAEKKKEEKKVQKRKRAKVFRGSGDWRKQKYHVRLRIYKKKGHLGPVPPLVTEIRTANFVAVKPILSPVHREVARKARNPCPPKYCFNVDVEKTKMGTRKRNRKVKRLKCSRCRK